MARGQKVIWWLKADGYHNLSHSKARDSVLLELNRNPTNKLGEVKATPTLFVLLEPGCDHRRGKLVVRVEVIV